jgi:hypothetical protein
MSGNGPCLPCHSYQTDSTAMILGGCLEADHSIREYEAKVRIHKRMMRDRAVWEQDQEEHEQVKRPKT